MPRTKKYSTGALQAASKPSMDDVVKLGKGISAAKKFVGTQTNRGYRAVLEPNGKQPTGWEPVTTVPGSKSSPRGSIQIAHGNEDNAIDPRTKQPMWKNTKKQNMGR